ncbi:hypothetical protein ACLOJK_036845 [Asimina triloba]
MSDLKTLIENSGKAIERLTFQVDQLVAYNKMLDEQDLQQESFSNQILGELQPQESISDLKILIENSGEAIKRITFQVDQLVADNEMLDKQTFQQEDFSNEILVKLSSLENPFHSQEVDQSFADKFQGDMEEGNIDSAKTKLEGHDKWKEIHYEDFSKYQPKVHFPSVLEGKPIDEIEAPNAVEFVSQLEEAEKMEQGLPKSYIPEMLSKPPSINLNEEESPQVELKIIPHSIRVKVIKQYFLINTSGTRFAVHRRSTSFGAPSPSPRPAAIAAGGEIQRDVQWADPIHPNERRRQAQPLSFVIGRRLSRSFRPNRSRSTNPASSSSMASTSATEEDRRAAAPSTPQAAIGSHANTKIRQSDPDARRTHLA